MAGYVNLGGALALVAAASLTACTLDSASHESSELSPGADRKAQKEASAPRADPPVMLSSLYGICVPGDFSRGTWTTTQFHDFSHGELRVWNGDTKHRISFSAGDVSVAGVVLRRADSGQSPNIIETGAYDDVGVIKSSGLAASDEARLWIEFKSPDPHAEKIAMELARAAFACEVVERRAIE